MSFKGGFRPPATGTTFYKPGGVPPPGDGNYVL